MEWLAVDLFSLLLQVHVRVDLEDTRTVAWNHFTVEWEIADDTMCMWLSFRRLT